MNKYSIIYIALGIIILTSAIIVPFLIIIYVLIALYPLGLIFRHKTGYFVPHWNHGKDPSREIYLYFKSKTNDACILEYSEYNKNNTPTENTYRVDELPFIIAKYHNIAVPIIINDHQQNLDYKRLNNNFKQKHSGNNHYFYLSNLKPDSVYKYKIYQKAKGNELKLIYASKYAKFFTSPAINQDKKSAADNNEVFRIAVFGDIQIAENLEIIESYFCSQIRKSCPEIVLSLGDNVHKYKDLNAWRIYNRILRKILPQVPFYTTPGNHDFGEDHGYSMGITAMMIPLISKCDVGDLWNKNLNKISSQLSDLLDSPDFPKWNYSFIYKNVFFITLLSRDIENEKLHQDQLQWLENELAKADKLRNSQKIDWIIFFTHVPWWGPPYNRHSLGRDELYFKDYWKPILEKYKVDLYLAGHKHSYCRDGNKFISGSMHGVRDYPEIKSKDYKLRNSHQFLKIRIYRDQIIVDSITWFGKILEQTIITK
ncbi:MAG: metallophosphoesterase family protein [Promethearchaeota archaeon]